MQEPQESAVRLFPGSLAAQVYRVSQGHGWEWEEHVRGGATSHRATEIVEHFAV